MTLGEEDGVPADDDGDVDIMGNSSDVDIIDLADLLSAGSATTCIRSHIHANVPCTAQMF